MKKKLFITECLAGLLLMMGSAAQAGTAGNNTTLHPPGVHNLQTNKKFPQNLIRRKPDLMITGVTIKKSNYDPAQGRIFITVKNGGGPIPNSQFSRSSISLLKGNSTWGTYALKAVDRSGVLKRAGATLTFPWNAILVNAGTYNVGAFIDSNNAITESNEHNNRYSPRAVTFRPPLPDLVGKNLQCMPDGRVQVTIANVGRGGVPAAGYNHTNGVGIQLYKDGHPWGGLRLAGVDPHHTLASAGRTISFPWFPNNKLTGAHTLKLVVDNNNSVRESNEGNNSYQKRLTCGNPDLGLYGFIKIGKKKRQIEYNRTITLTPADAHLISNGRPAFDIYYGYREYNGVAANGFENKIHFNSTMVSRQSNLALGPKEIKQVHTQAYMGPAAGRLCIKIDANNHIRESGESNNNGCINVRFSGFGNGVTSHPKTPIGKIKNVPHKKPNFLLPGDKVKKGIPVR